MLTETEIRNFCGRLYIGIQPVPNSSYHKYEQELVNQVSKWGLRYLFDGGCSEYGHNNILEKICTVDVICRNMNCNFSDVLGAFAKSQLVPSMFYRMNCITLFFNDVFDAVADGWNKDWIPTNNYEQSLFAEDCQSGRVTQQIINFARNREWESWARFINSKHYDIIEHHFERIFDLYFMRNRPLPNLKVQL